MACGMETAQRNKRPPSGKGLTTRSSKFLNRTGMSFSGLNTANAGVVSRFRQEDPSLPLAFSPITCSICLESDDDRAWWKPRACSHLFHRPCVWRYVFDKNATEVVCPVCGAVFERRL